MFMHLYTNNLRLPILLWRCSTTALAMHRPSDVDVPRPEFACSMIYTHVCAHDHVAESSNTM